MGPRSDPTKEKDKQNQQKTFEEEHSYRDGAGLADLILLPELSLDAVVDNLSVRCSFYYYAYGFGFF
jgi:hypothetical protein